MIFDIISLSLGVHQAKFDITAEAPSPSRNSQATAMMMLLKSEGKEWSLLGFKKDRLKEGLSKMEDPADLLAY